MKKILITGANSYIGMSFETYMKQWSDEYQIDTVDMIDGTWREKDFSGYDTVFHVAGIAHSDSGKISEEKAKLYYKVNTELTEDTAVKAKTDGVKQFIYMSSMIVYGASAPIGKQKIITKDTIPQPENAYGDSKLQAENRILPLQTDEFQVVVLRPPMIYGKGSKGNYPVLSKYAKKLPVFPDIENQRSMLYIENLCEFIRLMIKNEESGVFMPQNAEYTKTSEMVRLIAEVNGKKIRLVKWFNPLLRIGNKVIGVIDKVLGNLVYSIEVSDYKENYRIVNLEKSIQNTES